MLCLAKIEYGTVAFVSAVEVPNIMRFSSFGLKRKVILDSRASDSVDHKFELANDHSSPEVLPMPLDLFQYFPLSLPIDVEDTAE